MKIELPKFPGDGTYKSFDQITKGPRFIAKPRRLDQPDNLLDRWYTNKKVSEAFWQ